MRGTPTHRCDLVRGENGTGLLRSSAPFAVTRRRPLFAGFHGGVPESDCKPLSPYPCLLAIANNLRRLFPINDDSGVASFTSPSVTLLGGIPSQILGDPHLAPLLGLRISRYPRGYAVTSTPEEPELHRHGVEVIKEPPFFVPIPYGL